MIVRREKVRRNIRVRTRDGRIINAICNSISRLKIDEDKYTEHIAIIPIIKNKRSLPVGKNPRSTTGVYSFNIFLGENTKIPTIPFKNRRDMERHIRIYARKKYNIMLSNIESIQYFDKKWGMTIYLMILKNRNNVYNIEKGVNYYWNNYCIMYDNREPVESIYNLVLSENKKFLDDTFTPGDINAPEVRVSMREIYKFLELRNTSVHTEV